MTDRARQIAVIVVNWNRWRITLDCLAALRASEDVNWHLYLVDNASTDGSREQLRGLGTDVTLLQSKINGGWTGGNNIGVRSALAEKHKHLFLLNNDALVKPNTLRALFEYQSLFERPPLLGPIHRTADGGALNFIGSDIDPDLGIPRQLALDESLLASLPDSFPVAYIRGAGIFAHREHFNTVGLFDERYYLNYDESDWCFRAREAGYQVLMLKTAEILHEGSATIGGGFSPLNRYFMTRNCLLFAEEHCDITRYLRVLASQVLTLVRMSPQDSRIERVLSSVFSGDPSIRAMRAGLRDYLLRRFGDCPAAIRTL